jgi:hypothetical protein
MVVSQLGDGGLVAHRFLSSFSLHIHAREASATQYDHLSGRSLSFLEFMIRQNPVRLNGPRRVY